MTIAFGTGGGVVMSVDFFRRISWPLQSPFPQVLFNMKTFLISCVQGYLAYKEPPPRKTLQSDHALAPMAALGEGAFLNERGTPVAETITKSLTPT